MDSFLEEIAALASDPALLPAIAAIAVAGAVRGFAGFGAAMLFMPFGAVLFDPRVAVVAFFFIDWLVAAPLIKSAIKKWDPWTMLPCLLGSWAGVGFGAYLLANTDALTLRWAICVIIIALVALMASGWRYHGEPKPAISLGVGATSGVLGGVSQVSAPPIVAYLATGPMTSDKIRANIIMFFFFASLGSAVAFFANGVIGSKSVALAVWLAPVYGAALYLGSRAFAGSDEQLFRRVAFSLILLAAITSLPLLDPILRG